MVKVVITGASGFLGKSLIKCFAKQEGYQVHALTSDPVALKQEPDTASAVIHIRELLFNNECAKLVFEDADIINCAFPRNTDGVNMANGLFYINKLFSAAKEYHARSVINISSQSVYSQKRTETADENTALNLESVYATGKYATELMLNAICCDLPHTNLRLSSLIGPGFNQRITNRLIDSVICTGKAKVSINERLFGFMDIRDAVTAILSLIRSDIAIWKEVYCVGTGRGYSLVNISDDIVRLTKELLGFMPEIQKVKTDESGNTSVSGELLKRDTGFECSISLYESLLSIYLSKLSEQAI